MFTPLFTRRKDRLDGTKPESRRLVSFGLEGLEGRQLLSGCGFHGGDAGGPGGLANTIAFSLTPAAVQTELTHLATIENLTAPTATQNVTLGNANGVETYTITLKGTGIVARLTSDQLGNPVTAPTNTTAAWSTLDPAGPVATEITAIATALGLTAPTATTNVNVSTPSTGAATYSVTLSPSSSSSTTGSGHRGGWDRGVTITVDANGNPVGNQNLPFSVIPAAIQAGLNAKAPAGATALAADSTQTVRVQTLDGVTLYSVTFTSSGAQTTVTVNAAGAPASLPTHASTTFSALTAAVQTELQALATAKGITTTIDPTQTVDAYTEANGVTLYSVTLSTTTTDSRGRTHTSSVTLTVDADGNPTTAPNPGSDGFAGPGGPGGRGDFGGHGGGCPGGGGGTTTGTGTGTGTGSGTISSSPTTSGKSSTTSKSAATTKSVVAKTIVKAAAIVKTVASKLVSAKSVSRK